MFYKSLIKPLLFRLEPEKAHIMTAKWARKATKNDLSASSIRMLYNYQHPLLSQSFLGHIFLNPVGLAAGFDKNGHLMQAMENLGMGFVEVGSITARASLGNPRPRAFRLPEDQALINRMGLNNDGATRIVRRLQDTPRQVPVGVNIAKTHDTSILGDDAIRDYYTSYKEAVKTADYITLNISCPNTAEGKTFEDTDTLDALLSALEGFTYIKRVPVLVKFSSDLSSSKLSLLLEVCELHQIDGYVASNTSSSREKLKTDEKTLEAIGRGGLSGPPLLQKSLNIIHQIRRQTGPKKLIIGVGGIDGFDAALAMLQAGANLLQLYTGLIYEGPGLVKNINQGLVYHMQKNGLSSLKEL